MSHLTRYPSGNTYGKEFYVKAVTKADAIRKFRAKYGKEVIISSVQEFSYHIKGQECVWSAYQRE